MKNKLTFIVVMVISIFLFGCTAQQPVGGPEGVDLPEPAGSDSALAGQGFSTGSYDHTYQLYNSPPVGQYINTYFVQSNPFRWVKVNYDNGGQIGGRGTVGDLTLLRVARTTGSDTTGMKLELDTNCRDYSIEVDGNSRTYWITSSGGSTDTFTIPNSNPQPIRQIVGTNDAITIHSTQSRLAWFTLHCDDVVCTETDGGRNFNQQGSVTFGNRIETDSCAQNGELTEWVCENNQINSYRQFCSNIGMVCLNGACQ